MYGLEATLPIEYEVEPLRIAIGSRPTESQSLNNRLTDLEELDERRRMATQHIEAIQRRGKIIFNKWHKKIALRLGMMVMNQDARKLDFSGKFDAVWLGLYLVREVFLNNSMQLETLNGESFPTRTFGSRCKEYRAWIDNLPMEQESLGSIPRWSPIMWAQKWSPHLVLFLLVC